MKKVLLIDDDHAILDALSLVLVEAGYEVKAIDSGKDVIPLVKSFQPCIIFTDIWMSGKDGIVIAKEVKQVSDIPVIVISALSDAKKLTKQQFITDLLPKPFTMEEVLRTIKKYCDK